MMLKRMLLSLLLFAANAVVGEEFIYTDQRLLESILWSLANPADNLTEEMVDAYVPLRYRDSLPKFSKLFEERGWTTNQLIEGLISTFSNNVSQIQFRPEEFDENFYHPFRLAETALATLGEINHPRSIEFVKAACSNESFYGEVGTSADAVIGIYRYSDFGEETMRYMYNLCVKTNLYDFFARDITWDMVNCCRDVTNFYRYAAITNVSRFLYFSINNSTTDLPAQDWMLRYFLPDYSNSVARIHALSYVIDTSTNEITRTIFQSELDELLSIPPEELNDMTWLENAIIESCGEPSMQSYSMESHSDNDGATEGNEESHLVSSVVRHIRDFFAAIWHWLCGLFG